MYKKVWHNKEVNCFTLSIFLKKYLPLIVFTLLTTLVNAGVLEIVLTIPPSTPGDSDIFITGSHSLIGNWNGAGKQLKEIAPGLFTISLEFNDTDQIEFKFTRGSFQTVEKSDCGREIPNRTVAVRPGETITKKYNVGAWADAFAHGKPQITGDYQIFRSFSSENLHYNRDIIVWLPPSYSVDKNRRFPVLYMHDGRNIFDPSTSFSGIDWGVDEAMTDGINNGSLIEAIVVAVDNTPDRMSEYTPFPDPKHLGGNGESYVKFLVDELKPFIDNRFRTLADPANTHIGGSSLGGLISLYAGISRPETFGGIIAMSPSIWWADGKIVEWILASDLNNWQGKIWMDMGTKESATTLYKIRDLAKAIDANFPDLGGFKYREFYGATHSEACWRSRIHLPLKHIFSIENH